MTSAGGSITTQHIMALMPPIAPGSKIKIEVYNTGYDLITTVTYPDKDYSLCTCVLYLFTTAALISGIYYLVKWFLTRKEAKPTSRRGSTTSQTSQTVRSKTSVKSGERGSATKTEPEPAAENEEEAGPPDTKPAPDAKPAPDSKPASDSKPAPGSKPTSEDKAGDAKAAEKKNEPDNGSLKSDEEEANENEENEQKKGQ